MNKPEGHKYPHKEKADWNLLGQGKSSETIKRNMKGKWMIKWNEQLQEYEEVEGDEFNFNVTSTTKGLDQLSERHMTYKDFYTDLREDNQLRGGVGDITAPEDVLPAELAMGVQIEMEHTSDVNIATEIALDHLTENPHYYTKLRQAGLANELDTVSPSGYGDPTSTFNQEDRLGNSVSCGPGNNIVGTMGKTPDGSVHGKADSTPIIIKTIDIDIPEPTITTEDTSNEKFGTPAQWAKVAASYLAMAPNKITKSELQSALIGVRSSNKELADQLQARIDNNQYATPSQVRKLVGRVSENKLNHLRTLFKETNRDIMTTEMTYKGNVGIAELMAFYNKADVKLISAVEKLLKSGNEKIAWKIIIHFLKKSKNDVNETWKGAAAAGMLGLASLLPAAAGTSTDTKSAITAPAAINNIDIIAATLIGEAGGEGIKGMQAVLNVIMNRAKGDINNAVKVCLKPYQFSMWNNKQGNKEGVISREKKHPRWKDALDLIAMAKDGKLNDITDGADFYFNPKLAKPSWAKKFKKTISIGNHDFYNHGTVNIAKFF